MKRKAMKQEVEQEVEQEMEPSGPPSEQRTNYGRFTKLLADPPPTDEYTRADTLPMRYSARRPRPSADQLAEMEEYMRGSQTPSGQVARRRDGLDEMYDAARDLPLYDAANDLPMEADEPDVFDEDIALTIPPPLMTTTQINQRRALLGFFPRNAAQAGFTERQEDMARFREMAEAREEEDEDAAQTMAAMSRRGRGYRKGGYGYGRFTPSQNMRGSY